MWFKCIIILLLFAGNVAVCQETDRVFSVKKNEHLKEVTLMINDLTFDYRVLKHYSQEELASLDEKKLKGIHFIYTSSYKILDKSTCPEFSETDIDIAAMEIFRKDAETVVTSAGDDCKILIELMPRRDLLKHIQF